MKSVNYRALYRSALANETFILDSFSMLVGDSDDHAPFFGIVFCYSYSIRMDYLERNFCSYLGPFVYVLNL